MSGSIKLKNSILLLTAALFWGGAFVVQKIGGSQIGAYTFNSFRMLIGAFVVFIAIKIFDHTGLSVKPAGKKARKDLIVSGLLCGIFLTLATNLQQVALSFDISSGKAGFITALYIIIVPIIGLFFRQKCGWNVWAAVAIALVGLYLLCINGEFSVKLQDMLVLLSAFAYAFQITAIGRYTDRVDGLRLSCIEFLFTGITTLIPALIIEIIPYEGGFGAWAGQFADLSVWLTLLYMGIFCCAVAYTFQIIGMKGMNPTVASLLMSFESVFALISGIVFLKQNVSVKELIGCAVMFIAICFAQISFKSKKTT